MLPHAAAYDRLEIGDVCDIDDLINALHECTHRVICRKTMTQEHNKIAAPFGFGALDRGEFREFDSVADLERYLETFSEEIISKSAR